MEKEGEGGREGGKEGMWGRGRKTHNTYLYLHDCVHVALQYTYTATNSTYTTSEAKCTEGNPSHLHS